MTYQNVLCTYQVVSELQVGDDYRVAKTVERTAAAGTKVSAVPEAIDGYHCVTDESDWSVTVTSDGTARIVLRYDQDAPSYGVYFRTGGSYVASQTGHVGDAVTVPEAPTKAGYAFTGWDTDGDGKTDALPTTIPDHDTFAQAVWTPATATYQVQYYFEESGDEYGGEKHYELRDTKTLTGTTDSATPAAERLDTGQGATYQYYQYASETSAQIAGDGTTVVKVYYDLKPVTVYYYVPLGDVGSSLDRHELVETKTLNMFQKLYTPDDDAALALYKKNGGSNTSFFAWYEKYATTYVVEGSTELKANSVVFDSDGSLKSIVIASFANDMIPSYIVANYEGVTPGDYSSPEAPLVVGQKSDFTVYTPNSDAEPFTVAEYRCSTSFWDGKDSSKVAWGPWHEVDDSYLLSSNNYRFPSPTTSFDRTTENVVEIRFARRTYTVTYYSNGTAVGTSKYRYGATFTPGDGIAVPTAASSNGLVFAGWAASPDATEPMAGEIEMPGGDCSLYALWKRPDVKATFDSGGGTSVASQQVAWGDTATDPEAPTREGYEFGGWYYFGAGSSTPARFSFEQPLESDITLFASWKSTARPTTYTVIHKAADGTVLAQETRDGVVGETVTASPLDASDPARAGYRYVSSAGSTIDLAEDAAANSVTFVYSKDPAYVYLVRYVDAATGKDIADMVAVPSGEAVVDVTAPQVAGYVVRGSGTGYAGADGTREVVFLYDKVATAPSDGGNDAGSGTYKPANAPVADSAGASAPAKKTLPATGDAPWTPFALVAAAGSALIGLSARLRKANDYQD